MGSGRPAALLSTALPKSCPPPDLPRSLPHTRPGGEAPPPLGSEVEAPPRGSGEGGVPPCWGSVFNGLASWRSRAKLHSVASPRLVEVSVPRRHPRRNDEYPRAKEGRTQGRRAVPGGRTSSPRVEQPYPRAGRAYPRGAGRPHGYGVVPTGRVPVRGGMTAVSGPANIARPIPPSPGGGGRPLRLPRRGAAVQERGLEPGGAPVRFSCQRAWSVCFGPSPKMTLQKRTEDQIQTTSLS